jgi:hypothetical protein
MISNCMTKAHGNRTANHSTRHMPSWIILFSMGLLTATQWDTMSPKIELYNSVKLDTNKKKQYKGKY